MILCAGTLGLVAWLIAMQVAPDLPGDLLAVPLAALALVIASRATAGSHPPCPLRAEDGSELAYANRLGV